MIQTVADVYDPERNEYFYDFHENGKSINRPRLKMVRDTSKSGTVEANFDTGIRSGGTKPRPVISDNRIATAMALEIDAFAQCAFAPVLSDESELRFRLDPSPPKFELGPGFELFRVDRSLQMVLFSKMLAKFFEVAFLSTTTTTEQS